MTERMIFPFNAPMEFPPIEINSSNPEQSEEVEAVALSEEAMKYVLRPLFRDKEIREQLTSKDTEFINDIAAMGIEATYGDRRAITGDDVQRGGRGPAVNTSVRKEFAYEMVGALVSGGGIEELIAAKKIPSRTEALKRLSLLRDVLVITLNKNERLDAEIMRRCHDYVREEYKKRVDIIETDVTLAGVMRALYEQGLLDEAQYYAFGKHIGTVELKGETPTGSSPKERERRRKRELANDPLARNSAIALVRERYEEKVRLSRRPHSGVVLPSDEARRYFSWLLGNKTNSLPPVPRELLGELYVRHHVAHRVRVDKPQKEKIDLYLTEALVWTFTAK